MLQRRLDMPDATVFVLQGLAFMLILASETLYGRLKIFQPSSETNRSPSGSAPGSPWRDERRGAWGPFRGPHVNQS
jgi:hypothetical protein